MTKPSLSWIEPHTMASLLARASGGPRPRPVEARSFDARSFDARPSDARGADARGAEVWPVEARTAEGRPLSSRGSRTRTLPPPMLPVPSLVDPLSSAGRLPDFVRPEGGLEERLQAFLNWVNFGVSPLTAFVADESGLPLAALAEDALVAVTAPCMAIFRHLWSLSGGEPRGRLVLVVEQDRLLHVAEAATPWGRCNVAILAQTVIPDATMMTLQRGLATALSEPGDGR